MFWHGTHDGLVPVAIMVMLEVIAQKRECLKPTQARAEAGQNTLILPSELLQISIVFKICSSILIQPCNRARWPTLWSALAQLQKIGEIKNFIANPSLTLWMLNGEGLGFHPRDALAAHFSRSQFTLQTGCSVKSIVKYEKCFLSNMGIGIHAVSWVTQNTFTSTLIPS